MLCVVIGSFCFADFMAALVSEYESSIIGATHGLGMIDSPGVGVELAF
jgi:hypothetical protein